MGTPVLQGYYGCCGDELLKVSWGWGWLKGPAGAQVRDDADLHYGANRNMAVEIVRCNVQNLFWKGW